MTLEISKRFLGEHTSKRVLSTNVNGKTIEAQPIERTYDDAISALNGLQSIADTVQLAIGRLHNSDSENVKETERYLNRVGVTLEDLDRLSVIHVAGTKGKGTTCALVESILRHLNVKTGFFSSPHLINVNERIRLNGLPLPKGLFSEYFWTIYDTLNAKKVSE